MTNMFEPDDEAIRNLVLLAKECETVDPIDWGELNITEEQAYIIWQHMFLKWKEIT